ncbi:7-deoxyloganetic acid glucosyltransferase-like [Salvia hispanica]|uniref:7-deoxyloganetic acid glucosyltransferase-like n=1 Tax=Salvia hispanica TaxID=49212 RepID=UPI002009C1EF|nr:7-deoxyloganetic acid glucosyltransferase-like [Salvia hispanica]
MSIEKSRAIPSPHILIIPIPLQGHVNSMLNLAEILCLSGLRVTILLSDYTHDRLLRHASLDSRFSSYTGFRVATISDGLPDDHPRSGSRVVDIVQSLQEVGGLQFRRLMVSTDGMSDGGARPRVSCLIMDGMLSFPIPVAQEMGIPFMHFPTISACGLWPYFCVEEVIDAGELLLRDKNEDKLTFWKRKEMDLMVTNVPGMEKVLRRRDLPSFFRVEDVNNAGLQSIIAQIKRTRQAIGLILNTFEDLEGPILDQIDKHNANQNLYSIGPLHLHLKELLKAKGKESSHHSSSLWKENDDCIAWLDSQLPNSVIYVSFGSVATLTRDELLEFWYGLVNSGKKFLWVVRADSIAGDGIGNEIPVELEEGTKLRGLMVEWVPQELVLSHKSVGAFFTHSGWNSTLESIVIGVPMLCWPYFADQMVNSRFVSEVWKIGLDVKDTCDRLLIERMVREVMEVKRDELLEKARGMANMANKAICEGGSSHLNLNRLIQFLKSGASSKL